MYRFKFIKNFFSINNSLLRKEYAKGSSNSTSSYIPLDGSRFRSSRIKPHFQQSVCQSLLLLRLLSALGTRFLFFSSFLESILVSCSSFFRWTKYDAHTANITHSRVEGFQAFPFYQVSCESVKTQPSVPLWQNERCFSPFLRMLAIVSWLVAQDGCVRPNCVAVIRRSWSSDAFDSLESSVGNAQAPFAKRGKLWEKTCRRC